MPRYLYDMYRDEYSDHYFTLTGFFGAHYNRSRYGGIRSDLLGLILLRNTSAMQVYHDRVTALNRRVFSEDSVTLADNIRNSLGIDSPVIRAFKVVFDHNQKIANGEPSMIFGTGPLSMMIYNSKADRFMSCLLSAARNINHDVYLSKLAEVGVSPNTDTSLASLILPDDGYVSQSMRFLVMPTVLFDMARLLLTTIERSPNPYFTLDADVDVFDFDESNYTMQTVSVRSGVVTGFSGPTRIYNNRVASGILDYTIGVRSEERYHMRHLARSGYINFDRDALLVFDDTKIKHT